MCRAAILTVLTLLYRIMLLRITYCVTHFGEGLFVVRTLCFGVHSPAYIFFVSPKKTSPVTFNTTHKRKFHRILHVQFAVSQFGDTNDVI